MYWVHVMLSILSYVRARQDINKITIYYIRGKFNLVKDNTEYILYYVVL